LLLAFLIFFVRDQQAVGFAAFGTLAHLVMATYDQRRDMRGVQLVVLTCCGAIMIAWGTAVSTQLWLAVLSACVVGFSSQFATVLRSPLVASPMIFPLAFLVAATSPAPAADVVPRLGGWLLSGILSLLVIQTTWVPAGAVEPAPPTRAASPLPAGFAVPARAALAAGLVVLIAGVFQFRHGFWLALGIFPVMRAADAARARTFWEQQRGTLGGFVLSAVLVAVAPSHREIYWFALPLCVFAAAYASVAVSFAAGQAAFTVFVVVLLNVLTPAGDVVGHLRVEDIAIGGAIGLLLGAVYPRSARRFGSPAQS
jgi:hypothetical protein